MYHFLSRSCRGALPGPDHPAIAAPLSLWRLALAIERCGPAVDRALRAQPCAELYPSALRALLAAESERALANGLAVVPQLREVARVARALGIPLLALKGGARLLTGELPGMRSISDIDLLVPANGAHALHEALVRELGYRLWPSAPPHHLGALQRQGALSVELHLRLGSKPTPLDAQMWRGARRVTLGPGLDALAPAPTQLLLHTLEHAAANQWGLRYRLRDILDIASAWSDEVDAAAVSAHVRTSPRRRAMETLLVAALGTESRAAAACHPPERRAREELMASIAPARPQLAWRLVRRVGLTRLTAAGRAREESHLTRLAMLAGVLAEGSPRSLARLAGLALRRPARLARVAAAVLAAGACAEATRTAPEPPVPPPFLFVSDVAGRSQLFRYEAGSVTPLAPSSSNDSDPSSAADRLLFTSDRDGDADVYLAALDGSGARALTTSSSYDGEPAIDAAGRTVVFVSLRSGTPRLWTTDTLGSAATELTTGSAQYVPERHPAWSPAGSEIAFTSTRTGTSQIFLLSAEGGAARQLTRESGGAFEPAWSPDGERIYYVTADGTPRIRSVLVADGVAADYAASDAALGEPACSSGGCIARSGSAGGLVFVGAGGASALLIAARDSTDRQPALLAP